MATIKDIAKKAGVSISTVSYALNNSPKISQKTKEKIWKIANELNYQPNTFARSLKGKKRNLIGLVVHEIRGPYYQELVRGIQDVAVMYGYNLIIFCELENKEAASVDLLNNKIVDGALLLSSHITREHIEMLSKRDIPLVLMDRKIKMPKVSSVIINNQKGGKIVARHLYELGHRRIGYMHGALDSMEDKTRFKGFKNELKNKGINIDKRDILNGNFTEESGYKAMKNYLEKNGNNIATAFFCANDEMAIGAISAIKEFGLNVPQDISIVGFDNILLSTYITPKLTTIKRPVYDLGKFAAYQLLNMLDGKSSEEVSIELDVELVIRESTEKPRNV
ncbi:MAG: LacI family DNA-binding transcriptional regulator [Thermosipho sp. (in: Bacteria)]|nr:LacI family DNA-binding transcriptional regulator [Thermosipho sp. (in: thermotogales)]